MPEAPWSPAAFEDRYAASADPWNFATSAYELGRYRAILAALEPPPHRYASAYEPACSVGVLTEELLDRCDALTATDVSPTAVARARERCGDRPGATIQVGAVEDGPGPARPLDLLVLSEVGYYLDRSALRSLIGDLAEAMAPGGDLVACHWMGESPDHQLSGSTVHQTLTLALSSRARHRRHEVHDGFLLDAWRFPS